ncbi:DUF1501 domain-containing protein [Rubripirellula tenax]|nr:DUF1501 domain-containing protein [Rubripirellula tenax]
MAGASASSAWLQLEMAESLVAAGPGEGYRALVCLFLGGGNDSFNMLMPNETSEYTDYSTARGGTGAGGLAIPQSNLLPIGDVTGRSFGLHPSMTQLRTLYNAGEVAFVANVGSLVEPVDKAIFEAYDNRLPLGLFSHADLARQWQTAMPRSRDDITGWGGRMADILTDPSRRFDPIALSIAIDSTNLFQAATYANPYIVGAGGTEERDGYFSEWSRDRIFRAAHEKMLARNEQNLVKRTHSLMTKQAIEAALTYNAATANVTLATVFPETYLGQQMERIARTIAAHESLDHNRQTFFVNYGNWDLHGDLLGPHAANLAEVDAALAAFYASMVELGLADCVTTFTASDFGRTLAGNGQGSDHGWGGNQIVMGGGVNGGRIYGDYPLSLAPGSPLDVGRGRLIPTVSVDQYAAELSMWFGIGNNADLETILPNIRKFYSTGASGTPLGMFS